MLPVQLQHFKRKITKARTRQTMEQQQFLVTKSWCRLQSCLLINGKIPYNFLVICIICKCVVNLL